VSGVRRACIDIGSNTTRLLVADTIDSRLENLEQQRVFTHVRQGLQADGRISPEKIAEVVSVASAQLALAREYGAQEVVAVATAAVRRAANGPELAQALERACGLELRILSEDEEARLAFIGACGAAEEAGALGTGELGVADVGGGSSELVVGTGPDQIRWSASLALGSGDLADACFRSDPPSELELEYARARVEDVLGPLQVPRPAAAVAVGGSAASLRRLAGDRLDGQAFRAALAVLSGGDAAEVARRSGLDAERVRLLPAGLLILQAVQERFGVPLQLVGGGLREGVLMELEPPRA
jgi:exopolyphosphatase/guanosine-5'-triphosphate,3'-diphosphate pyrophosphatase